MDESDRPAKKRNRALTIALVGSLAVHLAALPLLRVAAMAKQEPAGDVVHFDPARPTPTPFVPPPTPRPIVRATQPPRHVRPRVVAIAPPHTHARSAGAQTESRAFSGKPTKGVPMSGDPVAGPIGPADPPATAAPIGEPAPVVPTFEPTVAPVASTCAGAPHDARVVDPVTPDRPAIAAEEGAVGRVEVRVDLSQAGTVVTATVYKSSGNAALDTAAVDAAHRATYASASDGCRAIAGSYIYTVDYDE